MYPLYWSQFVKSVSGARSPCHKEWNIYDVQTAEEQGALGRSCIHG